MATRERFRGGGPHEASEADTRRTIRVTVNGEDYEREVDVRRTLGDFIREDLRLTGLHYGCEHGVCGACTVLLDGNAVRSCLMLAVQVHGRNLKTIEGVASPDGELSPIQQAFWDNHGLQCGFCTPGMVLATEDWVEYRTGFPTLVRKFLFRKVPPTGWFHTLGSSLLTVFILQATTGALLAMTYDPSPNGAYESIRYITDVQTLGWLVRGMHKWGASVMVILLFLHMGRTFFYGAYKYPREMTWLTGSLIFISVMGMGLTGYLLVWDERAYWASVVAININGTAPVLGPVISRMTEWCTRRSMAAAVVIGSLKILSHSLKTRLLVIITLRRSYLSARKVNSTSISSRLCWTYPMSSSAIAS